MKSLDEYILFYKKTGRCLDATSLSSVKPLNDRQLATRYDRYARREDAREEKLAGLRDRVNPDAELIRQCRDRDQSCVFIKFLGDSPRIRELELKAGPFLTTLDVAHVFGKGAYPWMRRELENVVLLNRYSHSMVDQGKHPIDGTPMDPYAKESFWFGLFTVGSNLSDAYDRLQRLKTLSKERGYHGKAERREEAETNDLES